MNSSVLTDAVGVRVRVCCCCGAGVLAETVLRGCGILEVSCTLLTCSEACRRYVCEVAVLRVTCELTKCVVRAWYLCVTGQRDCVMEKDLQDFWRR